MNVSVTVKLSVPAVEKHWRQMRQEAELLTNGKSSVQVSQPAGNPKSLSVRFTVPNARQEDVVDHIGRQFWNVEDYADLCIGFGPERRRPRRRDRHQEPETNPELGKLILEIVENQIRDSDPPETRQTVERLIAEGYTADEARRLVATAVTVEIFHIMRDREPFNRQRFLWNLAHLPRAPWEENGKEFYGG